MVIFKSEVLPTTYLHVDDQTHLSTIRRLVRIVPKYSRIPSSRF